MARPRLAFAAVIALALGGSPAWSAEPAAEEGPVSTAGPEPANARPAPAAAPETIDLDRRIRDYLDDDRVPAAGARKPHGEVSVAVGTGGYRDVYARAEAPVGQSGSVSIAIGESRGRGGWFGPVGGLAPLAAPPEDICRRPASWRTGLRPVGCEPPPEE